MGLWVSAYAIVVAISAIPLTAVLARWPKRRALVLLLGVYAASNAVVMVAPSFEVGLAGRVVGGVAHAGIFSVVVSAAVALAPPAKTARAVAVVNAGVAPALALGLPAATAVGGAWGWRLPFAAATVILVLLAAITARVMPATPQDMGPEGPSARQVLSALRGRGLQIIGTTTVVLTVGHYTAYTYVTPVLLSAGVAQDALSIVLLAYGVAGIGGLVLAGTFADRFPVALLRATVSVTAIALVAIALVNQSTAAGVMAVVVWGVAFSAVPTLLNAAALRASTVPDAAPAVVNAMFNVGIAAGAWLGGHALLVGGTDAVALVGALLVALALPLTLFGWHNRPAHQARRR